MLRRGAHVLFFVLAVSGVGYAALAPGSTTPGENLLLGNPSNAGQTQADNLLVERPQITLS
jgi:hypothetical protein